MANLLVCGEHQHSAGLTGMVFEKFEITLDLITHSDMKTHINTHYTVF